MSLYSNIPFYTCRKIYQHFLSIGHLDYFCTFMGFLGGSESKESACNAGDRVLCLGRKDFLEKGMATHSSILAWRIPWTEEPDGLQSIHRVTESQTQLSWLILSLFYTFTILNNAVIHILFFKDLIEMKSFNISSPFFYSKHFSQNFCLVFSLSFCFKNSNQS